LKRKLRRENRRGVEGGMNREGLMLLFLGSRRGILAAGKNPSHQHRAEADQRADRERVNAPPIGIKSIHDDRMLRRMDVK
jgi:hypothetical protein